MMRRADTKSNPTKMDNNAYYRISVLKGVKINTVLKRYPSNSHTLHYFL